MVLLNIWSQPSSAGSPWWLLTTFRTPYVVFLCLQGPIWEFSGDSAVKSLPAMQETWVRSLGYEDCPGEGNGNPLQYSCLENPMDGGAWQATVHGVTKSDVTELLNNNENKRKIALAKCLVPCGHCRIYSALLLVLACIHESRLETFVSFFSSFSPLPLF